MINKKILKELKKVTGLKHISNVYKLINKTKRDHFIVDKETAAYFLAFKNGIRIERYLNSEELKKVQNISQNGTAVIKNLKIQRQSAQSNLNRNKPIHYNKMSKTIAKIITTGKKFGIENIDQNWIDALIILNFIETLTTKFLIEHNYSEDQVKNMKWNDKLTKLQNKIYEEAQANQIPIRHSLTASFKNYRQVRNDQDHIAHLPTSHITKDDLGLLQKYLDMFIKTVLIEHKKFCLRRF